MCEIGHTIATFRNRLQYKLLYVDCYHIVVRCCKTEWLGHNIVHATKWLMCGFLYHML